MFLLKILYGLIFMGIGYLILRYRRLVKSWTGNFVWAERYLGHGGTDLVILVIGAGLIGFGAYYMFGNFDII